MRLVAKVLTLAAAFISAAAFADGNPLKLHPEIQPLLKSQQQLAEQIGFLHITADNLYQLRAKDAAKPYKPKTTSTVKLEHIPSVTQGDPDVAVYVINAKAGANKPAILYMHGGGYILGSARDSVVGMQKLAEKHDCTVVTVDYRLAPETAFPGSLHDNYTALTWLYNNAEKLGVDKNRIVIMGASAGGGHAAMLAIYARDKGQVPVKHQILIYPMLDDRTGSSQQVPEWIGKLLWTPTSNQFGWSSLLGQAAGLKRVPYGSVPARVANLNGLPPTFIIVGSIDLFVDEDIEYAQRLTNAGVATELVLLPGMYHAAEYFHRETKIAKRFHDTVDAAVAGALRD